MFQPKAIKGLLSRKYCINRVKFHYFVSVFLRCAHSHFISFCVNKHYQNTYKTKYFGTEKLGKSPQSH